MAYPFFEVNIAAHTIPEPMNAYSVDENRFMVAQYTPETPYMLTCGLIVCKAVIIHNPETQKCLVAHVSRGGDLDDNMTQIVNGFEDDLRETNITIVEASRANSIYWPTIDSLASYFQAHKPRSLRVDRNPKNTSVRGVSMHLGSGKISEIDGSKGFTWSSQHITTPNFPINFYTPITC